MISFTILSETSKICPPYKTNIVPLKVMYNKGLEIIHKKSKGKMTK